MSGEGRPQDGSRLRASGKWGGEVGGGTEKRAGKTGSVSSGRGREDDSESLLNGKGGWWGGRSNFTPWRMLQCLAPPLPAPVWGGGTEYL